MIEFNDPWWLLLFPIALLTSYYLKSAFFLKPLRIVIFACILLALTEPKIKLSQSGTDLYILLDRSASAKAMVENHWEEMNTLLTKSKSSRDNLYVIEYAKEAKLLTSNQNEVFDTSPNSTHTSNAAHLALSLSDPHKTTRLLVVSDGYSTESLESLEERLHKSKTPMDLRLLIPEAIEDTKISEFITPQNVQAGQPYQLQIRLEGKVGSSTPLEIFRDGQSVKKSTVIFKDKWAYVQFTDRNTKGGAVHYKVLITPDNDKSKGNNQAQSWVKVGGGPEVLLITSYGNDPVYEVLINKGFKVRQCKNNETLSVSDLNGIKLVLINNVPAYSLSTNFIDALPAFVKVQGGGLLMLGGKYSFGSGGYFESKIDDLLPISMELRQDHKKLSVAMSIILDRSGSMGMAVAGGATKMDLANDGAARSVELLSDTDYIHVLAVDSSPHEMVPMVNVGSDRHGISHNIKRIASMGGGIYVYTGLKAAWEQLKHAPSGQRHIILFSDAADSEEPGDYKNLIAEMVKGGCSISVIGLGDETDPDADFLKDIAKRGNGRIFFNTDPTAIPAVFAQETVAVARSAFISENVGVQSTKDWFEMAGRDIPGLTKINGYNLSYLKKGAAMAMQSTDEYKAPLMSFWHRGTGRTAAVTFPLAGDHSKSVRDWKHYGDFLQTLSRWLMGNKLPPGLGLRLKKTGLTMNLDLLVDRDWNKKLSFFIPEIKLVEGLSTEVQTIKWQRIKPGWFNAKFNMNSESFYRGSIIMGDAALPFGPISSGINAEWAMDKNRIEELKKVSHSSGGIQRFNLSDIWESKAQIQLINISNALLLIAIIFMLLEVLISRLGWQTPKFGSLKLQSLFEKNKRIKIKKNKESQQKESVVAKEKIEIPKDPNIDSSAKRKSRYARAKNKHE